jgi:hypothetical protein
MDKYKKAYQQFRQQLYQNFNKRADTAMELVDALCSYPSATSPVELTLSPLFRRTHTALYKCMAETAWEDVPLAELLGPYLPAPRGRPFWLMGVDVTSQPRQFGRTVADRGFVYQPNLVAGNKPVTIGHQYSTLALLPEQEEQVSKSWVVPLSTARVATHTDKEQVGARQVNQVLDDPGLPWHDELIVQVGDSRYSKAAYIHATHQGHDKLVSILRVRSNRTFNHVYEYPDGERPANRPKRYGKAFKLPNPETQKQPDQEATLQRTSRRGKTLTYTIQAWNDMLMPGKNKPQRIRMWQYPFTLVKISAHDEKGKPVYAKPIWLIVVGQQRDQLSLVQILQAYHARSNLEHFFRFGKQKLLLTDSQTPVTVREERWWHLVHIAYAMLWMARHLTHHLPRPWEQYLPTARRREMSPTLVRRDAERLFLQLGSPAQPPQPRGKSPGRKKGIKMPPRPRYPVVIKGAKQPQAT